MGYMIEITEDKLGTLAENAEKVRHTLPHLSIQYSEL